MTRAAQPTQAAGIVHRGAYLRSPDRDRLDVERWLDEGGSFSSEAVATMTSGMLIAAPQRPPPPANPHLRPSYTCAGCGHHLRVSGLGRHRVYFELDDQRLDHPITNRVCSACGHGLPGKNPR